jgi:DNA-binding MarR family transcriptional regulator
MEDHDEVRQFREAFWLAMREVDSLRLQQWERIGLTLPQLRVLFQVRRTPAITTGDLARMMGISVSTTSGLVIKLEGLGLIERHREPGDRRREPLHLTAAGANVAGEIAETNHHIFDAVAHQLGDELSSTSAMLVRLGALIAEARDDETHASARTSPAATARAPAAAESAALETAG